MRYQKRDYTYEDRKKVLDYIIKNEGFYKLRGNAFWKEMENQKVLDRTWQSMKEHFRMKIVNNLNLYNLSKENVEKIISGYNNTKSAERIDNQTTHQSEAVNIYFSDEDKSGLSTSSDDSDNLVHKNRPNALPKEFRKQIMRKNFLKNNTVKKVSKKKILQKQHEVIPPNVPEQYNSTDNLESSTLISDVNSGNSPSCAVSETNQNSTCTQYNFSVAEDNKLLEAITKYDSNLLSCASIVTFIKQYTDYNNICQDWTILYDRFLEILNKLQFYAFLPPEVVLQLQKIKEPLEIYRSHGFQELHNEVIPIKLGRETYKATLAPNPDLIYLKQAQLDLLKLLENHRNIIHMLTERLSTGEVSQDSVVDVLKSIVEFTEKYHSARKNNLSGRELTKIAEVGIINDYPIIDIKQENLSLNNEEMETDLNNAIIKEEISTTEMPDTDNQSCVSDTIPVQPEISLNLSEIQNNNLENSQYLESLTTQDLNVTTIVEKIIENDLNESDLDFLTCESQV